MAGGKCWYLFAFWRCRWYGRRNVWNIVGARCGVQYPTLQMGLWWEHSKLPKTIWSCDKIIWYDIWCFLRVCRYFIVVFTQILWSLFIKQQVFCDSVMKRVFLYQKMYCGCRIHCLHQQAEYCGCSCTHCTHGSYAYGRLGAGSEFWR